MRLPRFRTGFMTFTIAVAAAMGLLLGLSNVLAGAAGPGGNEDQSWKPNRLGASAADYAGARPCAHCHGAIQATHKSTDMANAALRPDESTILRQRPNLRIERAPYTYSLESQDHEVLFTVSDGHGKITEPLYLVLGAGLTHQYYLIQHNGELYQIPVSYYTQKAELHWTGNPADPPTSLEAALGGRMTADRLQSCLKCHGTPNAGDAAAEMGPRTPGIHCEACHGPGAKHVAAMRAGNPHDRQIFNPASLNAGEELEFCGDCHYYQDVKKGSIKGIRTVTSPAYRLSESRCWLPQDKRSRCTFCHNPHQPVAREAGAYDAQCLSCHASRTGLEASAAQPGKSCPVDRQNCAGCHMPQVKVPGSISSYTDHRIRIVRAGEVYPE